MLFDVTIVFFYLYQFPSDLCIFYIQTDDCSVGSAKINFKNISFSHLYLYYPRLVVVRTVNLKKCVMQGHE